MSQETGWRSAGKNCRYRIIDNPAELARLQAQEQPDDGGAAQAASILDERERRGKPASAVPMILGLAEILTPEQMLELAQSLPALLSTEAKAKLAEALRGGLVAVNGA